MRSHLGLALAVSLVSLPAWADVRDPAAAEALFTEGRAAMKRGDYADAYAKLEESEALDPTAVGTLLNLAECEEHLGKVASAWQHLRHAKDLLPAADDRVPYATEHIAALEKQLPKLVLRPAPTAPASMHVRRGDTEVGRGSFGVPIPVNPGTYEVTASAEGFLSRRFSVEVRLGATTEVVVDVAAPEVGAPAAVTPWRTVGFASLGVGLGGLVLGTVTGSLAIARNDTVKSMCPPPTHDCSSEAGVTAGQQGQTFATISTASFIAGGVLVAAGVTLWLTHPRPRSEPTSTTALTLTPTGFEW
jgi:hypothetical protein